MHKSQWSDTILAYGRSDSFWGGRGNNNEQERADRAGRKREEICSRSVGRGQKEGERIGDMIQEPEVEDVVSSQ